MNFKCKKILCRIAVGSPLLFHKNAVLDKMFKLILYYTIDFYKSLGKMGKLNKAISLLKKVNTRTIYRDVWGLPCIARKVMWSLKTLGNLE